MREKGGREEAVFNSDNEKKLSVICYSLFVKRENLGYENNSCDHKVQSRGESKIFRIQFPL